MKAEVWDTDLVRDSLRCTLAELTRIVGQERSRGLDCEQLESPIEANFWVWWQTIELANRITGRSTGILRDLRPQFKVQCAGRCYRLDFALPTWMVAVELDGHEFHERTPEQVAERNIRDRLLQMAGWYVFHFSGSEISREPSRAIYEIIDFVEGLQPVAERDRPLGTPPADAIKAGAIAKTKELEAKALGLALAKQR